MLKRSVLAGGLLTFGGVAFALLSISLTADEAWGAGKRRHHHHQDGGAAGPDAGAPSGDGHDPGCLYGRMTDGHSGEVRCLSPDEVRFYADAGIAVELPDAPRDAGLEAGDDAGSRHATLVRVDTIAFDNGDVPRAKAVLQHLAKGELAKCASEHGGVRSEAKLEVKFLVRARGRAEGIDVEKTSRIPADVVRCMVGVLSNRAVGAPSTEPVAVTVTLALEPKP